ncbi:hypothetical protein Nmel_015497, partial [Mimus melanotis]
RPAAACPPAALRRAHPAPRGGRRSVAAPCASARRSGPWAEATERPRPAVAAWRGSVRGEGSSRSAVPCRRSRGATTRSRRTRRRMWRRRVPAGRAARTDSGTWSRRCCAAPPPPPTAPPVPCRFSTSPSASAWPPPRWGGAGSGALASGPLGRSGRRTRALPRRSLTPPGGESCSPQSPDKSVFTLCFPASLSLCFLGGGVCVLREKSQLQPVV